jgi:hypothetical protein
MKLVIKTSLYYDARSEKKHHIFLALFKFVVKKLELSYILKNIYICIPRSFLVINVCNQRKTLCSLCIMCTII